jgi:hypothetical protein
MDWWSDGLLDQESAPQWRSNPFIQQSNTPTLELVEPEVVATSPRPGKSRVPVCCGFDSKK